jgi:hypothetical protein
MAPGARQEPMQSTTSNRGGGYQIDGAADGENVYMVDGVNATNILSGGVGKNFQTDFIQEVQIKSSSFEAEYGGALGGVINAIPKRGSNDWHGEVMTYFQTSAFMANDACASGFTSSVGGSTTCGLRINPATSLNNNTRQDGTAQYFIPTKDGHHIVEPGFGVGGPIVRDRLWIFSGYTPTLDSVQRTTNFTGANAGPRRLSRSNNTHNSYNNLSYRLANQVRLGASWNYSYNRIIGTLGAPDSAYGQLNTGASTDPSTLRADNGSVNPNSLFSFTGDWTPTSKIAVSGRYGYFFNNTETRGTPVGIRYIYDNTLNAASRDVNNNPFPSNSPFNTSGYSNIPNNFTTLYNAYNRKSFNTDVSFFVGSAWGTHDIKTGFFWAGQGNQINISANTAVVDLDWGQAYTPVTSTSACSAVQASHGGQCQGTYGYFFVGSTTTSNTGNVNATDRAFYIQDGWSVKNTGLTLNLGVRFDQENNPAYDPTRFPNITFGWGDKIAPRLGAAYDVLHNGKIKAYGSYGKFFDIMKLGLTQGSFGSDYWHECVYALDTLNYNSITPTYNKGAGCPATGPAPGVNAPFIENLDLRATKADPRDPGVQPNMKPVESHELVAGVDWAVSQNWAVETRYSHKAMDRTIEDMSVTDNLGYYIGNPGTTYADILRRPISVQESDGSYYLTQTPLCAECPHAVGPIRKYDGLEIRFLRRPGASNWYVTGSYTYSALRGNYSGLTDTDATDGGGGRHSPNNGRAFDLPTMTYLANGKIDDGPLATDRPNTLKLFGSYTLKWLGQGTTFALSQGAFQGTPISTCLGVLGAGNPDSACQWAEGRGNFVKIHRDPSGAMVSDGVIHGYRTPPFYQTDGNIRHEMHIGGNENQRLVFEGYVSNLLNNHAPVAYDPWPFRTQHISPGRAVRVSDPAHPGEVIDPGIDWGLLMNGYNYMDAMNATGAFAGNVPGTTTPKQTPLTLSALYGMPRVYQSARQFRIAIKYVF